MLRAVDSGLQAAGCLPGVEWALWFHSASGQIRVTSWTIRFLCWSDMLRGWPVLLGAWGALRIRAEHVGEAGREQSRPLPPWARRRPTGTVASVGLPEQPCSQGRLCLEVKRGDLEGQPFVQKHWSHAMQESLVRFQVRQILWRRDRLPTPVFLPLQYSWASLVAQLVKNPPAMRETLSSIPGFRRSPGEGKGYQLQDSGLENSTDCIVHGVAKSQIRLSDWTELNGILLAVHCLDFQVQKSWSIVN